MRVLSRRHNLSQLLLILYMPPSFPGAAATFSAKKHAKPKISKGFTEKPKTLSSCYFQVHTCVYGASWLLKRPNIGYTCSFLRAKKDGSFLVIEGRQLSTPSFVCAHRVPGGSRGCRNGGVTFLVYRGRRGGGLGGARRSRTHGHGASESSLVAHLSMGVICIRPASMDQDEGSAYFSAAKGDAGGTGSTSR